MLKFDVKTKKLLLALDYDARLSLPILSKITGMSQQLVKYHLNKLEKEGVIRGYRIVLEIGKLGFFAYRVYFQLQQLNPENETKLINYFKNHENVLWFVSTQGRFDLEVLIMARNSIHFDQILKDMISKWGICLTQYFISLSVINYHFSKSYFLNKKRDYILPPFIGSEPEKEVIDELDYKIISLLSKDARTPFYQIGKKVGISYNTVKERVEKLKKKGIVQGYRTWIDTFKLGYKYYKVMISFQSLSKELDKELYSFCLQELNVIYFIKCIGEWHYEIDGEFINDEEFRGMLRKLRNHFSSKLKSFETLLIYDEYKMNYFPMGKI